MLYNIYIGGLMGYIYINIFCNLQLMDSLSLLYLVFVQRYTSVSGWTVLDIIAIKTQIK